MKRCYTEETLQAAILNAVRTGQTEDILPLFTVDLPKKQRKTTKAQIDGLKSWKYEKGCAIYKYEHRLPGVASWAVDAAVAGGPKTLRFRVLHFDMDKKRHIYLVPTIKDWAGLKLPDVALTPDESKQLLRLANDLTPPAGLELLTLTCSHPAKSTVRANTAAWIGALDQDRLFTLLTKTPELADIVLGAVDMQLRALERLPHAPWLIYNLIASEDAAINAAWRVLQACTFSNELSPLGGGPINLTIKSPTDLQQLRRSPGRCIFFRFREREQLQPMLKATEERERIAKSGGIAASDYPVVMAASRVFLGKPCTLDCQLPDTLSSLTGVELSLLRTAVKLSLTGQTAEEIYRRWKALLTDPANYAVNGALAWRYTLAVVVSERWFTDRAQREKFCGQYLERLSRKATAQADRERILRDALRCLANVKGYRDRIIEKPTSAEEAKARLAGDAIAFHHTPMKGLQKGKELLVCTKESLLRLLEPIGLTPNLYSTFCSCCKEEELLLNQDQSITLNGRSFHSVVFDYATLATYQG